MTSFNGKIEGIEPLVGNKDGTPWKLYKIRISGTEFITFNEYLVEKLQIGKEVDIEYEVKRKGMYENYEITRILQKEDMVKIEKTLGKDNIVIIGGIKYKAIFVKLE